MPLSVSRSIPLLTVQKASIMKEEKMGLALYLASGKTRVFLARCKGQGVCMWNNWV